MKQGRFSDAAAYAEHESLQEPGNGAFWLTQQARALVRMSDYRRALEIARNALEIEPDSAYAVATAADALGGLQRFEEALQHYEELLREPRVL